MELEATLDDAPLNDLEIVAVPYNAQRILDSLERASIEPRPEFPELEAELRAFRRRDPDSIAALSSHWGDARRRVARLADSLNVMGRQAPGYGAAYARFRAEYSRLAGEEAELEGRMRRELGDDRELAARAAAAADSVRRWETEAYRDFALLTAGFDEHRVSTDSAGRARISLRAGPWWLVARKADPDNPFLERAWNVPIVVSSLVPIVVPVSTHNVTLRWRR